MFKYRIILLLFTLLTKESFTFKSLFRIFKSFDVTKFKLQGTKVSPADEAIQPTVFAEDLYAVLGVSRNASREQLRDGYWRIAFQNHPDRNKSTAALEIYRNASYAYQILGKDEKLRREYDQKYQTKVYLDVLGDVGTGVIVPLAMDVAVPLINMTAQAVANWAFPLLKDGFEQSSTFFSAAVQDSKESIDSEFDLFTRAKIAVDRKSFEQRIKKQAGLIASLNKELGIKESELKVLAEATNVTQSTLFSYRNQHLATNSRMTNLSNDINSMKETLKKLKLKELRLNEEYKNFTTTMSEISLMDAKLEKEITLTMEEINSLESQLMQAKLKLANKRKGKDLLGEELVIVSNSFDIVVQQQLQNEKTIKESEKGYQFVCLEFDKAVESLRECETHIKKYNDELQVLSNNKTELNSKIQVIQKKREALDRDLDAIQKQRLSKEDEIEIKRKSIVEAKKKQRNQLSDGSKLYTPTPLNIKWF